MDEVVRPVGSGCSSEVEHTQSRDTVVEAASSSDSGWRPRELAFAPFVPRSDEQQVNAAGKSLKLRAFVRKPAAQIPRRDDPVANEAALELVRKYKLREVKAGHDGTWAAHPGLIPSRMEIFNNNMGNAPNQITTMKRDYAAKLTEEDLLQIPRGVRTMEGLRLNTRVGIQYVAAWLTRSGGYLLNMIPEVLQRH